MCEEITNNPSIPQLLQMFLTGVPESVRVTPISLFFSNEEILNSHFQNCNVKKRMLLLCPVSLKLVYMEKDSFIPVNNDNCFLSKASAHLQELVTYTFCRFIIYLYF